MVESRGNKYLFFSLVVIILVLFYLLKGGYILLLDYYPVPEPIFNYAWHINSTDIIFQYLYYLVSLVVGTMITQKIYLISIFFFMLYLPLRYFPEFSGENKVSELAKYVVAILFTINPFVYERFLAGQWGVLAGYVLLWPFVYYLLQFVRERSEHLGAFQKLLIATFLVGAFSFHVLIMCVVIIFITFIYLLLEKCLNNYCSPARQGKAHNHLRSTIIQTFSSAQIKYLKPYIIACILFVVASSYWLVPTIVSTYSGNSVLQSFDGRDVLAFKTNVWGISLPEGEGWGGDLQKMFGVFTLYGFWAEREPWAKQFDIIAFDNMFLFLPVIFIAFLGIWVLRKQDKRVGNLLIVVTVLSAVFSLGVGDTLVKPINQFLFDHVNFWIGFRDSQKWTAMVALFISVGFGFGLNCIFQIFNYKNIKVGVAIGTAVLICLYTPNMLMGFGGKIKPVDYPTSWYEGAEFLKNESERVGGQEGCGAVFLPWHMYYYLGFNNNLLTANPAEKFFPCKTYTSLDPEFGIGQNFERDKKKVEVNRIMKDLKEGNVVVDEQIIALQALGVQYVLVTSDFLRNPDKLTSLFTSSKLTLVFDSTDLAIYQITLDKK